MVVVFKLIDDEVFMELVKCITIMSLYDRGLNPELSNVKGMLGMESYLNYETDQACKVIDTKLKPSKVR